MPNRAVGVPGAVEAAQELRDIATEESTAAVEAAQEAENASWLRTMGVQTPEELPRQVRAQWRELQERSDAAGQQPQRSSAAEDQ